jgi:hypothetical protein
MALRSVGVWVDKRIVALLVVQPAARQHPPESARISL